jgi:hypothetical protein
MRWRGLVPDLAALTCRLLDRHTLLNRLPGPETRLKYRFPDPSCVAGVSPGAVPVSGDNSISTAS